MKFKNFLTIKLINVSQASALRSQMKNDQALEKIDELIENFQMSQLFIGIKADLLEIKARKSVTAL